MSIVIDVDNLFKCLPPPYPYQIENIFIYTLPAVAAIALTPISYLTFNPIIAKSITFHVYIEIVHVEILSPNNIILLKIIDRTAIA